MSPLLAQAARDGIGRVLHLAGREHRAVTVAGVSLRHVIVYAAEPKDIGFDQLGATLAEPGVAFGLGEWLGELRQRSFGHGERLGGEGRDGFGRGNDFRISARVRPGRAKGR